MLSRYITRELVLWPFGGVLFTYFQKTIIIDLFGNRLLLVNEKYETKAQQSDGVYPSRHWLLKIDSVGELLSKLAEPVFQPTPGLP